MTTVVAGIVYTPGVSTVEANGVGTGMTGVAVLVGTVTIIGEGVDSTEETEATDTTEEEEGAGAEVVAGAGGL